MVREPKAVADKEQRHETIRADPNGGLDRGGPDGLHGGRAGEKLTYADLVRRMTDLERLAVLPAAGRDVRPVVELRPRQQVRRGDRQVRRLGRQRRRQRHHPQEGDQVVLAEMEGPGCIWRIWSAGGRRRAREDLPRRPGDSRSSTCRSPTTSTASTRRSTTRGSPTSWRTSAAAARTCTSRFPTRSRARSWPTRAGATTSTSPTRRFPRARKRADVHGRS